MGFFGKIIRLEDTLSEKLSFVDYSQQFNCVYEIIFVA